jgi:hypothetical protein
MKGRMKVFKYQDLNTKASKPSCIDKMPLTNVALKQMMIHLRPEIKTVDD